MINLLIDRVENVNVFNFLDSGNSPGSESHIHAKMDWDLIVEYIKEMENISKVSRSFSTKTTGEKPDILKDLKSLGETFFDQFFPQEIANKLRTSQDKFLHFHIDDGLKDIPWDLLHDGNSFLADKFCIGKTVKGSAKKSKNEEIKKIKMLIIADPNEDLEWAQKEGEVLFQILKQKVPSNVLELEFIAGRQITKLKLLSMIKGKHIIHYAGHLYFSKHPLENGWLLSDDKVLKAREISNSGFSTNLVFSNSCQSTKATEVNTPFIMNYFAGAFLISGIKTFVGTNWEVIDNEKTLDFTIRFYLSLFSQKSVGEALFLAREFARRNYEPWDLTWANYTLHGAPDYTLFTSKKENRYRILKPISIKKHYPTPIAFTYAKILEFEPHKVDTNTISQTLIESFYSFSRFIGFIVFSDYKRQSFGEITLNEEIFHNLQKWWELIFQSMWNFKKLEISMFLDTLMEVLSVNREIIFKMIRWIHQFQREMEPEHIQGYVVTFQYYYENLLAELSELENCSLMYFPEAGNHYFTFDGYESTTHFLINSFDDQTKNIFDYKNKFFLYHKIKKQFLQLYGLEIFQLENGLVQALPNKIGDFSQK